MFKNSCSKVLSKNFSAKYIQNSFKQVNGNGPYYVMYEVIKHVCSNDVCETATCKLHWELCYISDWKSLQ